MKKNITAAIAIVSVTAMFGICGAIECNTISFDIAVYALLVLAFVAFFAGKIVGNEQRIDDENNRRAACRTVRRAAMLVDDELADIRRTRACRSVNLVRR